MLICKNIKPFDVDGTLILFGHNKKGCKFFNPNISTWEEAEPYQKHIDLLKRFKEEGCTILVWSRSGAEYTQNVIEALELEEYVDIISDKPTDYIDDEKCCNWIGQKVWLNEEDNYLSMLIKK